MGAGGSGFAPFLGLPRVKARRVSFAAGRKQYVLHRARKVEKSVVNLLDTETTGIGPVVRLISGSQVLVETCDIELCASSCAQTSARAVICPSVRLKLLPGPEMNRVMLMASSGTPHAR